MSVDLPLGPRPGEAGPPIGGPTAYPPEVTKRLSADAAAPPSGPNNPWKRGSCWCVPGSRRWQPSRPISS